MSEFAAAEAVFGSTSRGDSDAQSDRDILIVDSDVHLLARRQAALERAGWSVASYTFRKLNAVASKGALFLQHLKAESKILRDVGGRLRSTLDAFQPKLTYHDDLVENAHLADLISIRPNSRAGALWAADVLYVATRNFGILHLAQKGRYIFSYSQVLEALAEDGCISGDALPDLLRLRLAKSFYRSGQRIPMRTAESIVQRAIDALPESSFPRQSVAVSPYDILSRAMVLSPKSPAYYRLRNLERSYLSLLALHPTRGIQKELAALARWIQNPRAYTFIAATLEHDLIAQMQCIAGVDQLATG
jgi:hypothetical protein